jgi:hypothetical protein
MADPLNLLQQDGELPPDAAAIERRAAFLSSGSMDALSVAMRKKHHSESAVQLSAMMYKHMLMFYRSKKNLARDLVVPFVCVCQRAAVPTRSRAARAESAPRQPPRLPRVGAL